MNPNKPVHSPLSICYFSPGWPLDRFPNGVVSCVADLYAHLRTGGHKVTILANEVAEGNCDECVYNLQEARDSSGLVGRAVMGLWYRSSANTAVRYRYRRAMVNTFRRAQAEHGVELFEMEESFGWARWISRAIVSPGLREVARPMVPQRSGVGIPGGSSVPPPCGR